MSHIIGVDLGGTKLAGAAFTRDGEIVRRHTTALRGRGGADVAALVVEQVRALRGEQEGDFAIGVSVPGIHRADRVVREPGR